MSSGIWMPSGAVVRFFGIHPRPPAPGQSAAERDEVLMDAARRIAGAADGPQLVAGDFNATPWSPVVRRLVQVGGLDDPRIGRGWYPTWKVGALFRRWPLDQVLMTRHFTLNEFRVLPPFGADHQPVLAAVCLAL